MSPRNLGTRPLEADMLGVRRAAGIGRWVDWTPTVSQSTSVPITTNEAQYCIVGKVAHVYALLTVNNTGATADNEILITSYPAAITPALVASGVALGTWIIQDIDVGYKQGAVMAVTGATYWKLVPHAAAYGVGKTPNNFTLAVNDTIGFICTYRVA